MEKIKLKDPVGSISKKDFPYVSNFWKLNEEEQPYYIGLTSDIGMDTKAISDALHKVMQILSDDYPELTLEGKSSFDPNELTGNLQSNWYADAIWLSSNNDDSGVFVEPESDGTEFGIFFYGPKAEIAFRKTLEKIQGNLLT